MIQVQTIPGNVVLAFRPPARRPREAAETPQEAQRDAAQQAPQETGTVLLFTGTRYERLPEAEPAAPVPSDPDSVHS